MRIVAGTHRGRPLKAPPGNAVRPTADRVREALFSMLQSGRYGGDRVTGVRVLDACAGSGALGLEALSRGAKEAVLVERDRRRCECLRAVAGRLEGGGAARIVHADALAFLRAPTGERFDLAFVDPPFDDGLWDAAIAHLDPWLGEAAWLYVESPLRRSMHPPEGWRLHREGATRHARHALYRRGG